MLIKLTSQQEFHFRLITTLYQRRDSNSQAVRRWFLRPVCLPFHHFGIFFSMSKNFWSHLTDSNRRPSDYKSEALPTELRGREDYFFNRLCKVSACASTLSIKESMLVESIQVESVQAESEEEVEVSLEQAVKATNAAINNAFFILVCLSFIF